MLRTLCYSLIYLYAQFCCGQNENCTLQIKDKQFDAFKAFKLVVVGEKHRLYCGYDLHTTLFNHFVTKQHRTHLLLEYGYSFGLLVQDYIESGDTALLEDIKFFTYGEEALFTWIEGLRITYLSTPFRIHGIDIENQAATGLYALYRIIQKHELSDELLVKFSDLKSFVSLNEFSKDDASVLILALKNHFFNHKLVYKNQLAEDFNKVERMMYGFDKASVFYEFRKTDITKAYQYREVHLFSNVKMLFGELREEDLVFGQLGHLHTTKNKKDHVGNLHDWESITHRCINELGINVLSIAIINKGKIDAIDSDLFIQNWDQLMRISGTEPKLIKANNSETFDFLLCY